MSKKYKRKARKASAASTVSGEASAPANVTSRSTGASQQAFNPDYTYVTKDLRRIGLLAGTFISILVIMTFFLR